GVWFGDWNTNPKKDVSDVVSRGGNAVPILVPYNIPGRDCGSYSDGGAGDAAAYKTWINGFAAGIGDAEVVVILEPDALWMSVAKKCDAVKNNLSVLKYAVQALKKQANAHVYIDAGMAGTPSAIAGGLSQAGIYEADGFALNVSDSYDNTSSAARGHQISNALNGKVSFVIDTSRNGTGRGKDQSISDPWCNPKGLGLGKLSSGNTGIDRVDAFLWIKRPGQSDGTCNRNNPAAGQWFETRALEMAKNASL
ncbi:MAG: glycoside hydrolase family 6 protein, partial [Byssovorax sp.]